MSERLYKALHGIWADSRLAEDDRYANGPWMAVAADREWAVSSNAHILIAVPRQAVTGTLGDCPKTVLDLMLKWASYVADDALTVTADKLKAFAGVKVAPPFCERCKNTQEVTCAECNGEGSDSCICSHCSDEHDAICDECDGDGKVACGACQDTDYRRPVKVLDRVLNGYELAKVLATIAPDDESLVALSAHEMGKHSHVVVLQHGGDVPWFALVMGMHNVEAQVTFAA